MTTILISDERITRIPVVESGEPLVELTGFSTEGRQYVRESVAERLVIADSFLPGGIRLHIVEGLRPVEVQREIYDGYKAELLRLDPSRTEPELQVLASRFVSPVEVAPHVAGAAVDLTLHGEDGPLDLGTPIDATPEQSDGACFYAATNISSAARKNRTLLAEVLMAAGFVNYPTEWWHWSYGDRYWAYARQHPHALYGPANR